MWRTPCPEATLPSEKLSNSLNFLENEPRIFSPNKKEGIGLNAKVAQFRDNLGAALRLSQQDRHPSSAVESLKERAG